MACLNEREAFEAWWDEHGLGSRAAQWDSWQARALLSQPAAQAVEADSERQFDFKDALKPTPISGWGQQPIGMSTAAPRATDWLNRAIDLITAYRAAAVAPGNPPPHVEQDALREIISHLRSHP